MSAVLPRDDSRLSKANSIIAKLVEDASEFFDRSTRPVRFTFYAKEDRLYMRVRFTPTAKVLLCSVSIDTESLEMQVVKLEKTLNVIDDIDELYHQRTNEFIAYDESFRQVFTMLALWGIRKSKSRMRAKVVAHAQALPLTPTTVIDKDHVYFGIVVSVDEYAELADGTILVNIWIMSNGDKAFMKSVKVKKMFEVEVGRIYVTNHLGKTGFLTFAMAKHHLLFTPQDLNVLENYFKAGEEEDE